LPINDYAYWREVEARLDDVLPSRLRLRVGKLAAPSAAPAPAPVTVSNPTEPVA
jgi:hypothetical protein